MRLIDEDVLLDILEKRASPPLFGWLCARIVDAPTVDAIKVVHCKDCKHYQEWDDGNPPTCRMWTDQWDMPTEPNGYCHYGELKDSF